MSDIGLIEAYDTYKGLEWCFLPPDCVEVLRTDFWGGEAALSLGAGPYRDFFQGGQHVKNTPLPQWRLFLSFTWERTTIRQGIWGWGSAVSSPCGVQGEAPKPTIFPHLNIV